MASVILLCVSAGAASAQTTEPCHSMQRAGDILACYNRDPLPVVRPPKRANPSNAAARPAAAPIAKDSTAFTASTDQRAPYVDVLAIENSKLDSKMKTICRGC